MITRRQFAIRSASVSACLLGGKLALSDFFQGGALPDGSQSRGMITRSAQDAIDRGLAFLASQQY